MTDEKHGLWGTRDGKPFALCGKEDVIMVEYKDDMTCKKCWDVLEDILRSND